MATKKKGSVKLAGRFPVGTEVGLYRRHADILHPGTQAIKKGKVNDHGEVEFKALDPGEALFVAGYVGEDWRFVSVTASGVPADPDAPKPLTDKQVAEVLTQTRPSTEDRTVIGARNTANAKVERRARSSKGAEFAHPETGVPSAEVPLVPTPALSQEDARDLDQRSATVTGTATPVEELPEPRVVSQEEAKEKNLPTIAGGTTGTTVVVEQLVDRPRKEGGGAPNRSSPKRTQARKRASKPGTKSARKKTAQAAEKQPAPRRNTRKPAGTDPLAGRPGAKGRQRKR